MLGVWALFILQSISIGIVESLTQIPKRAYGGQLRRFPQEPVMPPVETLVVPEPGKPGKLGKSAKSGIYSTVPEIDSGKYKSLIERQLENHMLLQKMILDSVDPATASPPLFALPPDAAAAAAAPAPVGRRTDQAHIESRGPNDFLVIMHKMKDPFENYIPNDIFYAARPCVNWFDGCNEKGMLPPSLTRLDYLPF